MLAVGFDVVVTVRSLLVGTLDVVVLSVTEGSDGGTTRLTILPSLPTSFQTYSGFGVVVVVVVSPTGTTLRPLF
jgi:hypothetical protein